MTAAPTRLALPLGLIAFAVYVALVPWTSRVWLRTGDEPHYLIAAHSIAYDNDLDLRNNYDPNVYLGWYTTPGLAHQTRTRADGAEFLVHTYGLPFLIAPAYRLWGAPGVPYFLAALGALLAANVYLLGYQATRDWRASLVGWFVVAFSPPLLWYVFLIYPEMAGALCVTFAVRALINSEDPTAKTPGHEEIQKSDLATFVSSWLSGSNERSGLDYLVIGLALAALPWLSARFIPVMLTLAALAAWKTWRDLVAPRITRHPTRSTLFWPLAGLGLIPLSFMAFSLLNAALYGNPAPTASYAGTIDQPTINWETLIQLLRGLLGWLMDQQRGLLVIAPIYFVALVGVGRWLWERAWGALVAAATFGAALFSISLFGGFWIGVEPAARYLVFVLPPLGAGMAYAWAHRRGPWLTGLTVVALIPTLWASVEVIKDPLLAQTHDLIGETFPQIVPYLPSLGRNIYIDPTTDGTISRQIDSSTVSVPAGKAGVAFRDDAIADFSFGWYEIRLSLGAAGAAPDEPVARVLFQAGDNTRLLQAILVGRDFPADGTPRTFTFRIHNPVYNQWEQPPGMWVFTTGKAQLTLGRIWIVPEAFHSLVLPALWLMGLAFVGIAVASQRSPSPTNHAEPGWMGAWPMNVGLTAIAVAVLIWSLQPLPRTYSVEELRHFVGRVSPDAGATAGEALIARPDAADVAGVLASTRAQFYSPGRYVWRLRLKAGAASPEAILATTRIYAGRQPVSKETATVLAETVPADGRYHAIDVEFDNPSEQALVFELNYTAAGSLSTDQFTVTARK
ncbi:MAG: hypothetical protein HY260_23325 [Chloroflexi bacterium]|nr:hypothetical protein [Chloroflexota bacterium]